MTAANLPPLPEGTPARVKCDSCDGSGSDGHPMYQGEFQPPEEGPCPDCGGSGWIEVTAFDDSAMRAYAFAARAQPDEQVRDAERYRWLREQDWFSGVLAVVRYPAITSPPRSSAKC